MFQGAKDVEEDNLQITNSREQSDPMSRVFQEAKCAEKKSVLGSKVFQGEECSRKQTVVGSKVSPRSKVFQRAKCSSALCP